MEPSGPAVRDAMTALIDATVEFRRHEALLAEMLPLGAAFAGAAASARPAHAARVLDIADRSHGRTFRLAACVGRLHAAVLDLPVKVTPWRSGEPVQGGAPPGRIAALVGELDRRRAGATDPVRAAFETYAELQRIRPFDHGTGRVARVVLHLDVARAMGPDIPPVGLLLAARGGAHDRALRSYRPDRPEEWLAYAAECLACSAHAAAACDGVVSPRGAGTAAAASR